MKVRVEDLRAALEETDHDPEKSQKMNEVVSALKQHFCHEPKLLMAMFYLVNKEGSAFAVYAALAFGIEVGRRLGQIEALNAQLGEVRA